MQVPESIRKCVAFLYCKRKSGMEARGTVFFISQDFESVDGCVLIYAVTARHVIERIRELGIDQQSYFRLDNGSNGIEFIAMSVDDWVVPDDLRIDVAIAPVKFDFNKHGLNYIPRSAFLTDRLIEEKAIAPGDDLFFPGLFVEHTGTRSNIPIVRTGTIAAMPGEPINTQKYGPIKAYLVEARSIGGLSGSPVFIHLFWARHTAKAVRVVGGGGVEIYLLGLVHGHYNLEDVLDSDDADSSGSQFVRSVNRGIAIVIPASEIVSLLEHPRLDAFRKVALASHFEVLASSLPAKD